MPNGTGTREGGKHFCGRAGGDPYTLSFGVSSLSEWPSRKEHSAQFLKPRHPEVAGVTYAETGKSLKDHYVAGDSKGSAEGLLLGRLGKTGLSIRPSATKLKVVGGVPALIKKGKGHRPKI